MLNKKYFLKEVNEASSQVKFTVVSFFAGAGGSSIGYKLAGGKVLLVNEFIKEASNTYKINFPETIILDEDIRKINGNQVLEKINLKKGELDVLDGSPPCCCFSICGSREKGWGKEKKYFDKKQTTDDLFYEFIRILKDIMPKVFVCENVKGLTIGKIKEKLEKENSLFDNEEDNSIVKMLKNCGYKVKYKVLNSKYYGVPQTRERLFIVGYRNDLNLIPSFPKKNTYYPINLEKAFLGLEEYQEHLKQDLEYQEIMKKYAIYGESLKLKKNNCKISQSEKYFNLVRSSFSLPSPTITFKSNDFSAASVIHPSKDRKFTIMELKRIQTFPDDYIFTGSDRDAIARLGNAVPPILMANIAEHIYETCLKFNIGV